MIDAVLLSVSLVCPPEYGAGLTRANEELYNERYDAAEARVMEVRAVCPADPETYELRTSALIFWLKKLKGKGKLEKCGDCPSLIDRFRSDYSLGRKYADAALAEEPGNERLLFLSARLDLNLAWLNADILGNIGAAKEPFKRAKKDLESIVERNPRHIRSLTALAGANYAIGRLNPFKRTTIKLFAGISGSREKALEYIAFAVSISGYEYDRWEAKFALKKILLEENEREKAAALEMELRGRFPGNGSLNSGSR